MRTLITLTALLAAVPTSATLPRWNARAPENSQVIPSFSYATVEPVLAAVGARYQRGGPGAVPTLLVTFANGRKATLVFGACNDGGSTCRSLNIQANWTRIANSPPERVSEAVERFNRQFSFAKAYFTADGRPAMQRYLTADYGFVRGNLAINLLVFATQVDRFARDVLQPLETRR